MHNLSAFCFPLCAALCLQAILATGSLQPVHARVEADLDGLALSWTFTEGSSLLKASGDLAMERTADSVAERGEEELVN